MKIYTIGFTKKTARKFFELIRDSGASRVVDVRLNNASQLSAFAKKADLEYFLQELYGIKYIHMPELAPTRKMLNSYRNEHRDWKIYEDEFLSLMDERRISERDIEEALNNACLLCSEEKPEHCHRRLVAEYLGRHWGNIDIIHLG